ncbi:MAG: hypothetical protein AAGL97_14945, partial [Pseudomonadota bacterium]
EAGEWNHQPFSEAEIIPIEPRLPVRQSDAATASTVPAAGAAEQTALIAELVEELNAPTEEAPTRKPPTRSGRIGERIIMSLLALIFLGAGLAAAALSGFANFQAFSLGVSDLSQARIWGWSGVIASVCSFGGFTFFWWHISGHRRGEALRALVFALAGAGTSIAGTTLYMVNNEQGQAVKWQSAEDLRALTEAEIADWTRQLDGIPTETRSIEGLKAYLAGVEAAGRTHQKPYRDAQNELGLAERRARLEQNIATARADLRRSVTVRSGARPAQSLPAWLFALMLEIFSSQATSIAFVSLLLLYGRQPPDAEAVGLDEAFEPVV